MIETFSPGIEWYANRIQVGLPFSFARYGEGEWRVIVPEMHVKKQQMFSEWHDVAAQDAMRYTLLRCPSDPLYYPAIWHQRYFAKDGRADKIESWLSRNNLTEIKWHDGRVWRRAIENDNFHHIVNAVRKCPLPLVVVGPKSIKLATMKKLPVAKFIEIHPTHAYHDRFAIVGQIALLKEPSLISFSAGGTANILIHTLFPLIGSHSLLVDFGASWDVLSGKQIRPYAKKLTAQRIGKNWEGK
jgi:hypothetical protein